MGAWLVKLLKDAATFVIPLGTSAIVSGTVSKAVEDSSKITKLCAGVAGFFIDIAVSKAIVDCAHNEIDEMDKMITKRLPKGE